MQHPHSSIGSSQPMPFRRLRPISRWSLVEFRSLRAYQLQLAAWRLRSGISLIVDLVVDIKTERYVDWHGSKEINVRLLIVNEQCRTFLEQAARSQIPFHYVSNHQWQASVENMMATNVHWNRTGPSFPNWLYSGTTWRSNQKGCCVEWTRLNCGPMSPSPLISRRCTPNAHVSTKIKGTLDVLTWYSAIILFIMRKISTKCSRSAENAIPYENVSVTIFELA
jgi:hypothetical protein